jgi:hypothetical protein
MKHHRILLLIVTVVCTLKSCESVTVFPAVARAQFTHAPCFDGGHLEALVTSADMLDRRGDVLLAVPYERFVHYFMQPRLFPTWNTDYTEVESASFEECTRFQATFTTRINVTIPAGFAFSAPTIWVVNSTSDATTVGWVFDVANPSTKEVLYWGSHFFTMQRISVNGIEATHYTSWEKIFGDFVLKHTDAFENGLMQTVNLPDMVGASCLEKVWLTERQLEPSTVQSMCNNLKKK